MEHGMTRDNVLRLFRARDGRCQNTNDADICGVSFTARGRDVFVYTARAAGVMATIDGGATFDIAGSAQFSGTTSQAVYRWLVKNAYPQEVEE